MQFVKPSWMPSLSARAAVLTTFFLVALGSLTFLHFHHGADSKGQPVSVTQPAAISSSLPLGEKKLEGLASPTSAPPARTRPHGISHSASTRHARVAISKRISKPETQAKSKAPSKAPGQALTADFLNGIELHWLLQQEQERKGSRS